MEGIILNINERIYKLRKEIGMSQEELASLLGVSRQSVSKWEVGDSSPDLNNVIKLSKIFNCTSDYLLLGSKQPVKLDKNEKDTKRLLITAITLLFVPFLSYFGVILNNQAIFTFFIILGMISTLGSIGVFIYLYSIVKHQEALHFKNNIILYLTFFNILIFQVFLPLSLSISISLIIGTIVTIVFVVINTILVIRRGFKFKLLNKYSIASLLFLIIIILGIIFNSTGLIIGLLNSIAYLIYNIHLLRLKLNKEFIE